MPVTKNSCGMCYGWAVCRFEVAWSAKRPDQHSSCREMPSAAATGDAWSHQGSPTAHQLNPTRKACLDERRNAPHADTHTETHRHTDTNTHTHTHTHRQTHTHTHTRTQAAQTDHAALACSGVYA
eukprot:6468389-Amphidinium_carterae.1